VDENQKFLVARQYSHRVFRRRGCSFGFHSRTLVDRRDGLEASLISPASENDCNAAHFLRNSQIRPSPVRPLPTSADVDLFNIASLQSRSHETADP